MIKNIIFRSFIGYVIFSFTFSNLALAQGRGISILRDAEIEQIIREMSEPIFIAAELNVGAVDTFLVNDSSINAFVMGGQNVFINSGLLLEAETANQAIGVIAHETGHIALGHLSRHSEGMGQFATYSLLGVALGALAMAAGSADAGMALITGGQHVGYRSLLKFTRTQESSADQVAAKYLDATGQSGRGLIEFFEILGDQELVPEKYQDPYAGSHPLTSTRIERLVDRVQESPYYDTPNNPEIEAKFKLLQAKLFGYLKPFHATMVRYPIGDDSINARYARTFAYQQSDRFDRALAEIDTLIEDFPDNPFFRETKGQILYENGNVVESIDAYRNAVEILPSSNLLRMSLAQSLISADEDRFLNEAIENLEIALEEEPNNSFGWKQASMAYHRNDDIGMTHYSTAQHFLLTGDIRGAMINAKKAVELLPEESPKWIRAQDILMTGQMGMDKRLSEEEERREREQKERQKERNRS